jgi:hypothetical protein
MPCHRKYRFVVRQFAGIFLEMKNLIFIIFVELLVMRSNAQADSSLSGSWRLTALSNEEMYYDLVKDSLYISETVKREIGSIEEQKERLF